MTKFAVLRHGPTQWNLDGRIQGRSDPPLAPEGIAMVARWRLPMDARAWRWLVSPLTRARQTAEVLGLSATVEARLAEMNWGLFEGRSLAELRDDPASGMRRRESAGLDFRPPGGESPREVIDRLKPLLAEIARVGTDTGAVCHKGVIRALYALATGWDMTGKPPMKLASACLHGFNLSPLGELTVLTLNQSLLPPVGPAAGA